MNEVASHLVWDYPPTKQRWPTTGYSLFPTPHTPHNFPPGFSFIQVNTPLDATDAFVYENLIKTSALACAAVALWIPTALLTIFEIAKSRKGARAFENQGKKTLCIDAKRVGARIYGKENKTLTENLKASIG